jgi:hypothetical protein
MHGIRKELYMGENKGKPTDSIAEKKGSPGTKNETRRKDSTPGAPGTSKKETEFHPAGAGGPQQNAGGPQHHGGDAHEDNNP